MANRLHSSPHTTRDKRGIKNRGIAREIKATKRTEAKERQMLNVRRGFSVVCPLGFDPHWRRTPAPIEQF